MASNTCELCAICDLGEEAGSIVQRDEVAQPLQEVVDRIQQSVNDGNSGIKHMLTKLTSALVEAISSKCKAGECFNFDDFKIWFGEISAEDALILNIIKYTTIEMRGAN